MSAMPPPREDVMRLMGEVTRSYLTNLIRVAVQSWP